MNVGTRILYPGEVGRWDADILQISVYRRMQDGIALMKECAQACRDRGIRYVIHPVEYSVLDDGMFSSLRSMATHADISLILHDERSSAGGRLQDAAEDTFRARVRELEDIAHISFENAVDTKDIIWFWKSFAGSITIDIGHIEAAGMDSAEFIRSLDRELVSRIDHVHMHRNNGWRNGLTDHWHLTAGCRELAALRELLRRKDTINAILELNDTGLIEDSLNLLRRLRDDIASHD